MRIHVKIILMAIVFFLFPVNAVNPVLGGGSMQRLLEAEQKLGDNIKHHETHDEGPYTKALLNEMKAVSIQISDVMLELGCPDKKQDRLCVTLWVQQLGLTSQIAVQGLKWHDYAQDQVVKGMSGQQGGKVVFEKVVREDAGP